MSVTIRIDNADDGANPDLEVTDDNGNILSTVALNDSPGSVAAGGTLYTIEADAGAPAVFDSQNLRFTTNGVERKGLKIHVSCSQIYAIPTTFSDGTYSFDLVAWFSAPKP